MFELDFQSNDHATCTEQIRTRQKYHCKRVRIALPGESLILRLATPPPRRSAMPVSRYVSPFGPIALTLDEKEQLHDVANDVVAGTMAKYEQFLWQERSQLDPAVWKCVREREGTRVFHHRVPGADTGNRDMHLLLTVGTVVGTLNDTMYGVLNPTIEAFRIKTAYCQDTLFDMAVLDSMVLPTPELPYESMTLRWGVKRVPFHVRLVAKHTDTLYVETTGMRELGNGERIGIHLIHSVKLDQAPVLPQYERFNLSLCAIWRQIGPNKVQGYMTSYFEFKESLKAHLVVLSMADAVVAISRSSECGQLKKLAWLVQNKSMLCGPGHTREESCAVCGVQHRSVRRGLKSTCAICAKYTCNSCRVKRVLQLLAPDRQLLKHEMRFCMPCLKSARSLDGAVVAMDDAVRGDALHRSYYASSPLLSSRTSATSHLSSEPRFSTSKSTKTRLLYLSATPNRTDAPERLAHA